MARRLYPDRIHVHIVPPLFVQVRLGEIRFQFRIVHFVVHNAMVLLVQAWRKEVCKLNSVQLRKWSFKDRKLPVAMLKWFGKVLVQYMLRIVRACTPSLARRAIVGVSFGCR